MKSYHDALIAADRKGGVDSCELCGPKPSGMRGIVYAAWQILHQSGVHGSVDAIELCYLRLSPRWPSLTAANADAALAELVAHCRAARRCVVCEDPIPALSAAGRAKRKDTDTCSKHCRQAKWRAERRAARGVAAAGEGDDASPGRRGSTDRFVDAGDASSEASLKSEGGGVRRCKWCGDPIPDRSASGRRKRADSEACGKRCRQGSWRFGDRAPDRPSTGDASRRFAYADPPYPGMSEAKYGGHPDFAGEVDHGELVERLVDEFPDGWALSTSPKTLQLVLALCPGDVRIGAWVFPVPPHAGTRHARTAWEPVIFRGGRPRPADAPTLLNWVYAPPKRWRKYPGGLIGMKPPELSWWIFDNLGAEIGDELADLFPGSGAVGRAWDRYVAPGQDDASRGSQRRVAEASSVGRRPRRGAKLSPATTVATDDPSPTSTTGRGELVLPGQLEVYDLLDEAA